MRVLNLTGGSAPRVPPGPNSWPRRHAARIVALALLVTVFAIGQLPTVSAGDVSRMAQQYAFTPLAIACGLTVNPAMTIAALAERAVPGIVEAAQERGIPARYGAPAPVG